MVKSTDDKLFFKMNLRIHTYKDAEIRYLSFIGKQLKIAKSRYKLWRCLSYKNYIDLAEPKV